MSAERDAKAVGPNHQWFLWLFSTAMVATAGTAFVFKLYEFYHVATSRGSDALASFLIPVMTYLIVAAGFACMFLWAYLGGQFKDVEWAKHRMLELQRQVDRHDEIVRRGRVS